MSQDLIDRLCASIENNEAMVMSDLARFVDGVAQRQFPVDSIEASYNRSYVSVTKTSKYIW